MTTKRDWLFRAEHLRMQARHLDERAYRMKIEAEQFRMLADSAQHIAEKGMDSFASGLPPLGDFALGPIRQERAMMPQSEECPIGRHQKPE